MKLILEDNDIIIINQEGDNLGSSITCRIAEKDKTGTWIKVEKMQACSLFREVCNVNMLDGKEVLDYVTELLGFKRYAYGNQRAEIYIKSGKKGIALEINNQLFTPKELKEAAGVGVGDQV